MSTGVRITGLKEAIRSLEKLGVSVSDLKDAFTNTSNKVVQDAKALTPVRTGKLAASIRPSKAKNKALIRAGTKATAYASFVEFGSIHNTAAHMVREAITKNETYAVSQINNELDSLIRKYNLN